MQTATIIKSILIAIAVISSLGSIGLIGEEKVYSKKGAVFTVVYNVLFILAIVYFWK